MRATLLLSLLGLLLIATSAIHGEEEARPWWEVRKERRDLRPFPHRAHREALAKRDDACLACHPFTPVEGGEPDALRRLTAIANEPLEAICHQCHLEERSAPATCTLCHTAPERIRPDDHGADYTRFHAEAGREPTPCLRCHLELRFCTDCHLRRNPEQRLMHPLGWRQRHGLEARLDPLECATCHTTGYCRDCHRRP